MKGSEEFKVDFMNFRGICGAAMIPLLILTI
jgi:hypothetical protein